MVGKPQVFEPIATAKGARNNVVDRDVPFLRGPLAPIRVSHHGSSAERAKISAREMPEVVDHVAVVVTRTPPEDLESSFWGQRFH